MEEYKIITGYPGDCQKTLNQWRHEFELDIISMNSVPTETGLDTAILLTRKKK